MSGFRCREKAPEFLLRWLAVLVSQAKVSAGWVFGGPANVVWAAKAAVGGLHLGAYIIGLFELLVGGALAALGWWLLGARLRLDPSQPFAGPTFVTTRPRNL